MVVRHLIDRNGYGIESVRGMEPIAADEGGAERQVAIVTPDGVV